MGHANNNEWEKTDTGRDITAKSRKNQNAWKKRKPTITWEYWKLTPSNKWR